MRAFHDSRDIAFRKPFGAIAPSQSVTLEIDVWDAPNATATLRTWVDGTGEQLHEMRPVSDEDGRTRFQTELTPIAPGIIWYHFIITEENGTVTRYGAKDGRFGGEGELRGWEPPSFQLTVYEPELSDKPPVVQSFPFTDAVIGFMRGDANAYDMVEAIEAYRENTPEHVRNGAFDFLDGRSDVQLLVQLGADATVDDLTAEQYADYPLDDNRRGLAKGRMWCASLVQLLMPNECAVYGGDCTTERDDTAATFPEEGADQDCETIVRNAYEIRQTLPLFVTGDFSCFAVNDDVFGFWRTDGKSAVCVLVNGSLYNAHDICVPMACEEVSDIVSGYGVPTMRADETGGSGLDCAPACPEMQNRGEAAFARAHLYQVSSTILYFHPKQRLAYPLEAGMGALAHITSLPTATEKSKGARQKPGTLGAPAKRFVDWLADAGVRYWQVLPVNPTDDHGSPYAGISAFAGNTRLIEHTAKQKRQSESDLAHSDEYRAFCEREQDWLEPYAAFMAIRDKIGAGIVWQDWPKKYRRFDPTAIEKDAELREHAESWRQLQFTFEMQWRELRAYANERGIAIIGDMPIYVSSDSSDVWANPDIFQLGTDGKPEVVAGCPPDQFAVEGQIWGNPVYDWDTLEADGFRWWLRRLERAFELYDVVRLDHFIGFARYFSIPAGEKVTTGSYRLGPGLKFFEAAHEAFGPLPIIAEDLGSITPAVRALGAACGFPGMDIVQFVDGNDPLSGYQPRPEKIAYTGTHDNQTLVGYASDRYPGLDAAEVAEKIANGVATCCAPVSVVQLQDVIGLDDKARMNTPGTVKGNWTWQAKPREVSEALARMRELVELHRSTQA